MRNCSDIENLVGPDSRRTMLLNAHPRILNEYYSSDQNRPTAGVFPKSWMQRLEAIARCSLHIAMNLTEDSSLKSDPLAYYTTFFLAVLMSDVDGFRRGIIVGRLVRAVWYIVWPTRLFMQRRSALWNAFCTSSFSGLLTGERLVNAVLWRYFHLSETSSETYLKKAIKVS